MHKLIAVLAIFLTGAGSAIQRGDLLIPAPFSGIDGPGFALAQAEHVIPLVRATRTITVGSYDGTQMERPSDLRVSLVVLDLGPATDVSPRQAIHLAMFNEILEHGTAWALEPVAEVWEFFGVERTAPGIYEVDASIVAYETGTEGCYFQRVKITIDARTLSVAVRNAPGVGEFDVQRYGEPIGIEMTKTGCID